MIRRPRWLLAGAAAGALAGCINLAPTYHRPASPVPSQWPQPVGAAAGDASLIGWRQFFRDPRLQRVIAQALANNRDLRVTVLDIEKARAEYRIQRAELFPSISASASQTATRSPASLSNGASNGGVSRVNAVDLGFSSYELDLFGRLRNLKDEALENYLSTAETRRSTQITLVAEVASDWLTLAADQRLLAIARQTLRSQQQTYELVKQQQALGAVSALTLAQAEGSLQSARADVASDTTQVAQDRDALELLVGASVTDADLPDAQLDAVSSLASLPAGLPSSVLLKRPDVLAAEHTLKAANADIGAARANFFPSISLTASSGTESSQLSGLFKSGSRSWSFNPSINLPLFDGGDNRATLDEAKVNVRIDVANYEKAIQTAFSEVADALASRATIDQQLDAQARAVAADQHAYQLAQALYQHGGYSLLDLLTTQRTLYTAQQSQVSTQLDAQTSLVTLYKALGGGWYEYTPSTPATAKDS